VQHGGHGAALGVQALKQADQFFGGARIDRAERLIQQQHGSVLHHHAGEQHALELAGGQAADRPGGGIRHSDRRQRRGGGGDFRTADGAERAQPGGMAQRHHVQAGDREAAIQRARLRQQGDVPGQQAAAVDPPLRRLVQSGDGAQQRGLAGTIRPDDGGQAARRQAAGQAQHRRLAAVAERQAVELDRPGRRTHASAQATTSHSNTSKAATSVSLAASPAVGVSGSIISDRITLRRSPRKGVVRHCARQTVVRHCARQTVVRHRARPDYARAPRWRPTYGGAR